METRTERAVPPLLASLAVLLAVRGAFRAGGLLVLTAVVAATVGALTVGIVVLRIALG